MSDTIQELMHRLGIEGIAIPLPSGGRMDMAKEINYQVEYIIAGFQGDDQDSIIVREFVKLVRHWFAFIQESSSARAASNGNSKSVVEAIVPTQNQMTEALDTLMALATVRMMAVGVDPPKHPSDEAREARENAQRAEQEASERRGHGFVPPMGNAG